MAVDLERINTRLAKLQGITLDRVGRSLRFRTMNMLARFEPVRTLASWGAGTPSGDVRSDVLRTANPRQLSTDLKRDGIALGLQLPPEVLTEILAWANTTPIYGNICKDWGYRQGERSAAEQKLGRKFTVGHYFNTSECPAIRRLVDDPLIAELARSYIGANAKYLSTHMWWSYANDVSDKDRNEYAQQYHFDLDDYRFMKFFFYLTDVDLDSGPHTYMRGTHGAKKMKDLFPMRRFTDREVHDQWGADREVKVEGPAGSGFIVDTFGIHKGTPPRTRDRLVIELEWGRHYYGFGNDEVPQSELSFL